MATLMDFEAEHATARRPRFRYYGVVVLNTFGVLWTAVGVVFVVLGIYIQVTAPKHGNGAWFGALVGLLIIWSGLLTLRGYFQRSREIVVNDDGVVALAFGRTWRSIRWVDMARIERIRRPMVTQWNTWRDGYEFVIFGRGQNEEIYFLDKVAYVADLLKLLNGYVEQHRIPLVAFDRGSDTKAKIRATTTNRAERRRLLRQGYQTSLSSLTVG